MGSFIESVYEPMLLRGGFVPDPENNGYNTMGTTWRLSSNIGEGHYWIYEHLDLFNIRIHDFSFHEDRMMCFDLPESLNVAFYESISGEELSPYRKLRAGCVKTFCGGKPYRMIVHRNIPIKAIGIEITPTYYDKYMQQTYPDVSFDIRDAFRKIDQTSTFPEMERLLVQVKTYDGEGIAAKLFFEGKVAEAISLVADWGAVREKKTRSLSSQDTMQIKALTAYLDDHFALDLPLDQLAKIACMSATKLKYTFKEFHGCTISAYVKHKRVGQAEHLLADSDLGIGHIAKAVGYDSASHFSEVFRRSTGVQPRDFRKLSRRRRAESGIMVS